MPYREPLIGSEDAGRDDAGEYLSLPGEIVHAFPLHE